MKEWWVYELRAGDWLYIGMTSGRLKGRLVCHRYDIRHLRKPAWWSGAIQQFPDPNDWDISAVSGPFSSREDAVQEEEARQREYWDYPGRLWEKCGDTDSDASRKKTSQKLKGTHHSVETKKSISDKLKGTRKSAETIERMREAKRQYWARKKAASQ